MYLRGGRVLGRESVGTPRAERRIGTREDCDVRESIEGERKDLITDNSSDDNNVAENWR